MLPSIVFDRQREPLITVCIALDAVRLARTREHDHRSTRSAVQRVAIALRRVAATVVLFSGNARVLEA
jgi:hypothetical protein